MSEHALFQARAVFASLAPRLREVAVPDDTDALVSALGDDAIEPMDLLRQVIRAKLDADTMADATGERIKVLQERKSRHERRAEALRQAAFAAMDAIGLRSLKDPEFTATVSAGRASAIVTDEAEVPDEYWKVTRAIDKAAINQATKDGVVIPGVILTNGVGQLTIRSK